MLQEIYKVIVADIGSVEKFFPVEELEKHPDAAEYVRAEMEKVAKDMGADEQHPWHFEHYGQAEV